MRSTTLTKVDELIHGNIIKKDSTPVIIIGNVNDVNSIMKMLGSRMYEVPIAVKMEINGETTVIKLETIVYGYIPIGDGVGKMFSVNGLKTTLKDNLVSTYLNMEKYIESNMPGRVGIAEAQADFTYNACPYGILNIWDIVEDKNDNNPSYWWRSYHFKSQIVPGVLNCASNWKNSEIKEVFDADYYNTSGFLSDYSPTTTYGVRSVTVGLSVSVQGDEMELALESQYLHLGLIVFLM